MAVTFESYVSELSLGRKLKDCCDALNPFGTTMRLLYVKTDATEPCRAGLGIPFLLDRAMELVESANAYLRFVALERGRTRSPRTWRNHGEALYDYFSWLEANGKRWNDRPRHGPLGFEISNVAEYRNWSHGLIDKKTGTRSIKTTTINQRLACIRSFYRWANVTGHIDYLPWEGKAKLSRQQDIGTFRHLRAAPILEVDSLSLKAFEEPPKVLNLAQAKELVAALTSPTLRLMIGLMLQAGLRNAECRTFPRKYVVDPTGLNRRKRIRVEMHPEDMSIKNDRPRAVYVTWHLMQEMFDYLRFGEGVVRSKRGRTSNSQQPRALFLNVHGSPYSDKGLNNSFRRLWVGPRAVVPFRVTPHMLRHTFATLELYHQSKRLPAAQALAWVRDRLGHSSVQTTSVYVHCLDQLDDFELATYQKEIDEQMALAGDKI